ncbi:histidine kinase [Halobacterium wangiae]|uniref:histidine kinase n=1 Tax=Halobacterium wangiae TaxID=2902623 RepID=UPI001E5C8A04|nr:histidine kinase [Halobacterium wangiae]
MAGPETDDAPPLPEIVDLVDERELTLTLYNDDAGDGMRGDIRSYFQVQSVELRRATTDDGRPRNFFVLHDRDHFVDATSLASLYRVIRPDSELLDVVDPAVIEYPDLLRQIDQTVFTDYGRPRMTIASREIEEFAYRHGGSLHAGFQVYSNLKPQYALYDRIARAGVDTHLYGAPDWHVPSEVHDLHEYADDEITSTWFVVLDAERDAEKRALLAEERERDQFYGFWTFDAEIVDTILDRLEAFPPTRSSPFEYAD